MRILISALLASSILAGCVSMQQTPVTHNLVSAFDAQTVAAQMEPGNGVLNGTAFMRQRGGGIVTCAGNDVYVFPVNAYSTERMAAIYGTAPSVGTTRAKAAQDFMRKKDIFIPDPPEYITLARTTKCDAQGEFSFDEMKDGAYYIVTHVAWTVQAVQGGTLTTKIEIKNGKSQRTIMSL